MTCSDVLTEMMSNKSTISSQNPPLFSVFRSAQRIPRISPLLAGGSVRYCAKVLLSVVLVVDESEQTTYCSLLDIQTRIVRVSMRYKIFVHRSHLGISSQCD